MRYATSKIDSSRRMPCIRNGDMLKNRLSRLFRSYCCPKVAHVHQQGRRLFIVFQS